MNCKEAQSRLQSFLDGELEVAILHRMRAHLEQCAECGALKRDFERLTELARETPKVRAPENFSSRLQEQTGIRGPGRTRWDWQGTPLAWGAAAAIFALLAVSSVFYPGYHRRAKLPRSIAASVS